MLEIIALAGSIISGGKELMKNEAVAETVNGVFDWIGNKLGSIKFVTEKLKKVKNDGISEKDANMITEMLKDQLKDNNELQKELVAKLENVKKVAKQQGVPLVTKTNTITTRGNYNINLQDIETEGNFNIGTLKDER